MSKKRVIQFVFLLIPMMIILGHSIIPHHHHSENVTTCNHHHSESNDFVCSWDSPLLSEPDSDDNSEHCSFVTNEFRYSNQLAITLFVVKFVKLIRSEADESPTKIFRSRADFVLSSPSITAFSLRGPPLA